MDNAAQKAGDEFATIAGLVIPGLDVADAAIEAIGISEKIAEGFELVSVASEGGEAEGMVLRASDKNGKPVTEIWAKGEDGNARPMTKAEAEQLKKDMGSQGELLTHTRPTLYSFCLLPLRSTAIILYLSNTPSSPGFKDLEECIGIPGSLRKRMDGLPHGACANIGAGPGIDPEVPGNPNNEDESIFGDLEDIENLAGEQPIPENVPLPLPVVEAPVGAAEQAQYLEPFAMQPAQRADHYFEDFTANWEYGPQEEDLVELNVEDYDLMGQDDVVFGSNSPRDPVQMVLDEGGPADPQQVQDPGPLDGFNPPPLPAVDNLPIELMFETGDWEPLQVENFSGLSPEQQLAFANAGSPEDVFGTIMDEWQTKYRAGLPAYDGPPLDWAQLSRIAGPDVDSLAASFQSRYDLSPEFMRAANGLKNDGDFRGLATFPDDLNQLPSYQGIAYFWRSLGTKLGRRFQELPITRGRSYFDQERTYSSLKHLVLL